MRDVQVLCVDDQQSLLDLTETFLDRESDRISVLTATTADEALDVLAEADVDCVVSDYDLERRTGLAFLKTVREDHADVPFVLFTGKGSEAVAADAISAGVTDYLQKGGREQYALLANRVENAVDAARAERELERTREKTAQLHEHAADIAGASSRDAVVDAALSAADDILEFHVYGLYEATDDRFEPLGAASYEPDSLPALDDGVLGKTYQRGESFHIDDVARTDDAAPDQTSFRSAVSVPVGDDVVFQAIAAEPNAFTAPDLELTELLATHVEQAFERLDREREYERTTEQLQAILDNTTAIVYIKDREGRYELANERFREVVDVDDGELVGRTDWELQDDEFAKAVRANDRRAMEEERAIEVEEDAYRDGERRTYYSVKVPLFDDDGDPKGVCGISSDITELKERELELEQERNRLDEFASVVAHDLRGPLSVAEGYRELLAADLDDPRLDEIAEAHARMTELIDDVLSLAREGDHDVDAHDVSIAGVAESAQSAVDLPERVTVEVDDDGVVSADPSRLRRVFENCFRNAVDHGASTSRIRVDVTDDGFAIADDGDGLPVDARDDLFEYGVSDGDGTGIGLAVVREIVQAHGWSVECAESADGGARFEFTTAEPPRPPATLSN
ncbi:hybrid sensor histidine kinase/response regulator [Halorubellus salinus]|uniref:hybrid sensor histidine kinase/response regulator n=1 Tax=Halorubellus salinus TaxID=755309 RepID=UPI001D07A358|nr:PAS domain-containing protein [Halorubellus salinus]